MKHTEESLMALADEVYRTQWLLDRASEDDDEVELSTEAGIARNSFCLAIREVLAQRDTAFETWKKFHVDTLNAFIRNEYDPLKAECERLRKELEKQLLLKMKEKP